MAQFELLPMDLILGDQELRNSLEKGRSLDRLEELWSVELAYFERKRKKYLLYD